MSERFRTKSICNKAVVVLRNCRVSISERFRTKSICNKIVVANEIAAKARGTHVLSEWIDCCRYVTDILTHIVYYLPVRSDYHRATAFFVAVH